MYTFGTRDISNPYEKVIQADGLGYYSYLPAIFIYHDLSFSFINSVHPNYYALSPSFNPPTKNFINEFEGMRVNKYYPGLAVLWTPFFLFALLAARLFGLAADGYSGIFQYSIAVAAVFYAWLGLRYLKKLLLHFGYSDSLVSFTIVLLLFGTNLVSFTVFGASYAHCYLFFLVAAFCYYAARVFNADLSEKKQFLFQLIVCFAFILVIRPQDGLILLALPLFGFTFRGGKMVLKLSFGTSYGLAGMSTGVLLFALIFFLWHVQTGHFFLNPYHGEHFYLLRPHLAGFLFSFRYGWLLYTPLMILALAGIFFMKPVYSKMTLVLFWGLVIYILSSWWCWVYYGTSLGQRTMVDFYPIAALSLIALLNFFKDRKYSFYLAAIPCLTIPLNILQTHQFYKGIIPPYYVSAESYFHNFFKVSLLAQYPIPPSLIEKRTEIKVDGSSMITLSNPFSAGKKVLIPDFIKNDNYSHIRASAMIRNSGMNTSDLLVIDFSRKGKSFSWSSFNLSNYLNGSDWNLYECGLSVSEDILPGDSLAFYFWKQQGSDTTFIKNFKLEFIRINNGYDLNK